VDRIQQLATVINDRLMEAGLPTIAAAESCSGGGVASAITANAGSSAYFLGSIVAYVNDAKENLLHVSRTILNDRGAVSPECAEAMAQGARIAFGADLGISTTGIAGPSGATARKPVGLVYTALATARGTRVLEHRFAGDRAAITRSAIEAALSMLTEELDVHFVPESSH
jgi:PncC family amidohydrolase